MKAAEIRAIAPGESGTTLDGKPGSNQTDAILFSGTMLQEIAVQLAELNAKLEPDAIFATFKKVGAMVEASEAWNNEKERGRR
jgi:hypothetical protein